MLDVVSVARTIYFKNMCSKNINSYKACSSAFLFETFVKKISFITLVAHSKQLQGEVLQMTPPGLYHLFYSSRLE